MTRAFVLPDQGPERFSFKRELRARDAAVCVWCSRQAALRDLTFEHLIPLSAGGSNGLANLVLACFACNQDRADQAPIAYYTLCCQRGQFPARKILQKRLKVIGLLAKNAALPKVNTRYIPDGPAIPINFH